MALAAARVRDTPRSFEYIQVMRAIAALLVVLFHSGVIMAKPEYGSLQPSYYPMKVGWIGVNFFFVLSGFIILYAHAKDIGQPRRLGVYLWRRFSRLYPIYWIVLTAFVCASLAGLGPRDFSMHWRNMLTAYTLILFERLPTLPLKVAWTLLYEVQFYTLFAMAILNRRLGAAAFGIWVAAIIISCFTFHPIDGGFPYIWSANFVLGAGAYYFVMRSGLKLGRRAGFFVLGCGVAIVMALLERKLIPDFPDIAQNAPVSMLLLGLGFTAILAGGVIIEKTSQTRLPRVLTLFGDASYSIYLVHSAVMSLLERILRTGAFGDIQPDRLFLLLALGATAAGVLTHLMIEKPLLRLLRPLVGQTQSSVREG